MSQDTKREEWSQWGAVYTKPNGEKRTREFMAPNRELAQMQANAEAEEGEHVGNVFEAVDASR